MVGMLGKNLSPKTKISLANEAHAARQPRGFDRERRVSSPCSDRRTGR